MTACNILFSVISLFERQSSQTECVGPDTSDALFHPALSLQRFFFFLVQFISLFQYATDFVPLISALQQMFLTKYMVLLSL